MRLKRFRELSEGLTFTDEVTAAYSGQTNLTLTALDGGEAVGSLQYVVYRGEVSVSMLEVDPRHRRRGVGSELLLKLQSKYPRTEIRHGMQTPEAARLVASLRGKLYVDKAKRRKIAKLEAEVAGFPREEQRLRKELERNGASDDLHDRFNRLYDRWHEAEEELRELTI